MNADLWQFLLGEWVAEGGGEPGQGSGSFTFSFDLQGKVLVRRNHVDYPPAQDRPAFSHYDLMIVYDDPGKPARAIYFDNEGHVIHYTVDEILPESRVSFISDRLPMAPRFRLVYLKNQDESLTIKFEIAAPDQPDAFAVYTHGIAHRC